ncbi:relaxase/mobilization nuclease domain-containing protein [Tolypothrix sp. PCC 7601]|uniref:Relaxase/mobilization nuclease domain-containing protein n=1 Tax=Nostoc punctiforme FACHB-252 TaxID=1357509 RepID=A0ABR8HE87_NOSPU|nr:relaxase/mobilization nuclease domain-containing protein [Tolypothrix sp. PCC 7601]MBD2614036.1 relaxase/mobilization nuclease domain-containing protein [Nostoc punctiforme FACHB-252]MBE9080658.1 relaxase/mobilization nuclease domain-containing protein [Tolypothrix sp. LEGE 11397]UYD30433.1 relaxase/mobilization nuclease domain-containing protein [Tolypothrix sp. PCC 7712]UYD38294.1 relaxase/mobilization nuclease domain-containing protein [Tolypothrix sp. PCC 7601]
MGKDDAAIVDTNMMGTKPNEFNQQFLTIKYTNKAVKRQCAHLIISIAHRPNYHEHLSNSQYSYVAREYLKDMGYLPKEESSVGATSQFVAVRHHDRHHEHLHIIASRIRLDGSLVNDSYDYFNSQVSTRRIAAELGLEVTPTTNEAVSFKLEQEYGIITLTSPNRSKSIRAVNSKHKTPTSKEIIRQAIGEAIKDSPTVSTFIQRLEENNIGVLPKMQGQELLGFTYIHNDVKIAGYQVYKPYSWNKLRSEYGIMYDPDKDIEVIQKAKAKAIARINSIILSNNDYLYSDKPTNSSTSDSNGDTDSNSKTLVSTYTLNSNYPSEIPVIQSKLLEDKPTLKANNTKKQVQPHPQKQYPQQDISEENGLTAKQFLEEQSSPVPPSLNLLPSTLKHLPSIITDYMLVTNNFRIKGRELSASLDSNTLSVYRHGDNTPVMQTCYSHGNWYEEIQTRLTTNEIEQIESLRFFTQQVLMNKQRSQRGIEQ